MAAIVVGTSRGLRRLSPDGEQGQSPLDGHEVSAVAPDAHGRMWAVVDRRDLWRVEDGGEWTAVASLAELAGVGSLEATCLADTRANEPGGILVGTSEARLLRVGADGRINVVSGFDAAPGRDDWYTPWGGPPDTRFIAGDGDAVFVNVHVGGVLRSRDQGGTWQPTLDIHRDIHSVATADDRVYAAGATGLSVSEDGGDTWRLSAEGLHARYCRAVAICGEAVLVSASDGPNGRRAALYRSGPSGDRFERCGGGLPEWFSGNLDSLCVDARADGRLAAIGTQSGEVYVSRDQGSTWARLATGLGAVHCVRVVF